MFSIWGRTLTILCNMETLILLNTYSQSSMRPFCFSSNRRLLVNIFLSELTRIRDTSCRAKQFSTTLGIKKCSAGFLGQVESLLEGLEGKVTADLLTRDAVREEQSCEGLTEKTFAVGTSHRVEGEGCACVRGKKELKSIALCNHLVHGS